MIETKIYEEIRLYCEFNDITDIDGFINKIVKVGFNIEKYGNKPIVNKNKITTFENNLTETPLKVISTPVNTVNKQNIYEED